LIVVGIVICVGVDGGIQGHQGETREHVSVNPNFLSFWTPISYDILRVPDYLLLYLGIGVALATSGLMITAHPLIDDYLHPSRPHNA
jgi:hypothetical protein